MDPTSLRSTGHGGRPDKNIPPFLSTPMRILIYKNDQQEGPYTLDAIRQGLASGRFAPEDFAFQDGCADWVPLHTLLPAETTPPALPPQIFSNKIEKKREQTTHVPAKTAPPALPLNQHTEQTGKLREKHMNYVVLQVILKEKFIGTGSGNLTELEGVINRQAAKGYRLHTITTASSGSKGILGGDRIQATLVFEQLMP